MEIFLFLIVVIVIATIMPKPDAIKNDAKSAKLVVKEKFCPPHQWFWQEIIDQNGEKRGERMMCKLCGPLRNGEE